MKNSDAVSKFSHEIRNPLTLIYSSLQLLERECPAVCESSLWPQLKQDVSDLIALLKEFSSSREAAGLNPESVSMSGFLSEIRTSFSPFMQEHGIRFLVTAPEELLHSRFTADAAKLREALTNLLLNAADALIARPADRTILLCVRPEQDALCFHVRDNGPGIPGEYLASLFEPFVTHRAGGTGLGLSIARTIAACHGGSLTVDTCTDAPDTYADFCLRIPHNRKASTNPDTNPPICA